MATFADLKISTSARALVDQALARAGTRTDQNKVKAALVEAAGADANRVLSLDEVQAVVDAFEQVTPQGANPGNTKLTSAQLGQGIELAHEQVKSMASLGNLDGISNHFTFQESLEKKLIAELQGSVERANGRPMDVNMMIFEFQSDGIEKAIADIAKKNPNVTFRIVGDSGQANPSGGNALPSLLELKLPNVQVKFKKDFPYVWSQSAGRPVFSHPNTKGLNHHKGFATFIDGKPDRLLTGSFNWSNTADTKNYEDLSVYQGVSASTRGAITDYGQEFVGFWNNDDAALTPNNFANFRTQQNNAMLVANGKPPSTFTIKPDDSVAKYALPKPGIDLDVNGYRLGDRDLLKSTFGSTLAAAITSDRTKFGRFNSLADLLDRVPALQTQPKEKLALLGFGEGRVSINNGSLDELDQVGFTRDQAEAIVSYRASHGDFESLDDLAKVSGVTSTRIESLRQKLSAVDVESFFNSRAFSATTGGTGYGPGGSRTTLATNADGTVASTKASVTVAATDLFNAAKAGTPIAVAMYGLSTTAPEYQALVAAAKRGAVVRLVLNDDYTEAAVKAINALKAQGVTIDVRVQSAKTMHEKFGVVGDDVFSGSANFSESSSTKHSEDRLLIKNNVDAAIAFQSQFEMLWAKSKVV